MNQPEQQPDLGTPEQKALIAEIKAAKDLYQVLSLAKSATEDDVKKAYRKLALKLHPDKNKARGAEEAFKAVSKAFTTLSDPQKRAYYDRTGHENPQAAAASAQAQRTASGHYTYSTADDIDADEVFNMFFGGMFGPGQGHVFRTHIPRRRTQAQAAPDSNRSAIFGLLQLLPVLLLVLFSYFSGSQQPSFQLFRDRAYSVPYKTERLAVEYYVRSEHDFERSYPRQSSARYRLERQVESSYYEDLESRCQHEKIMKQRAWSWGNREQALNMKLESCDKLEELVGLINQRKHGYYYHT